MAYIRLPAQRWLLASFLLLLLNSHRPASATQYQKVWDARPPVSYFALTAGLQGYLRREAQLSPTQFA
jgi:hypothetical protein